MRRILSDFTIGKNAALKKLELTSIESLCLHQYFYLQHPLFGFMQLRLQTWAPFNIHVNLWQILLAFASPFLGSLAVFFG